MPDSPTFICDQPDDKKLIRAVEKDDLKKVKQLVQRRLKQSPQLPYCLVPGLFACFQVDGTAVPKNNDCLRVLATQGKSLLDMNIPDQDGDTPLHLAVMECRKYYNCFDVFRERVAILLKAGADVNQINSRGYTPLLMAASDGNVKLVELLLAADADPTICLPNGFDAQYMAEFKASGKVGCRELNWMVGETEFDQVRQRYEKVADILEKHSRLKS